MENFFVRYKNPLALMAVVIIQVVALATQVKRPENPRTGSAGSSAPLIRVWTITAFTPVEKIFINTGHFFRNSWHNYADLRDVRRQNYDLQEKIARLQLEQVQLKQDADQARRLQSLLEFKEKYIAKTIPAQVIATSGTEQSRVITIDKGSRDGLRQDMAVITPDGIVGKVKDIFPLSSQVLLINDHDSGAGVILEHSRLQGIVKGTSLGELQINDIMSDEQIEAGDHVITSGGDRIYPKGFSVGTVISAVPDKDNDPFLAIRIKPAADLRRLEEVLVVTERAETNAPAVAGSSSTIRAADILAQRLPSITKVDPNAPKTQSGTGTSATPGASAATGAPSATASPSPAKTNQAANNGTGGGSATNSGAAPKSGSVTTPAKPPATGTAAPTPPAATKTPAATTPAATKKTGTESRPAGSTTNASANSGSATTTNGKSSPSASPTPAKPKAATKKPKPPADGSLPGAAEPKANGQPGTEAPATPTPTPENPQL
jgi:rod shape-determining protein MreC